MTNISVSVAEAKRRFSDYINRSALSGCRVVITKRNRPVAALISLEDLRELEQVEKRKGLSALIGAWEGFEEVAGEIESAVEQRHNEGTGRSVSI